jgi:hypothetical protein
MQCVSSALHVGSRWEPSYDVVSRRLGDEVILVNLRTNRISSLNRTGARFWELLSDGRDWNEIQASLREEFDVEPDQLDRELETLVRTLAAGGFVSTRGSRPDASAGAAAPSPAPPARARQRAVPRFGIASLVIRMGAWSVALPFLKHLLPLPTLVRLMARPPHGARSTEAERQIVRWARRVYRARNPGTCLERSLLAYRYLSQASADPRLVVGVGKGDREFLGHAWVLVDDSPLYESDASLATFVPVVEFAADGSIVAPARAAALPAVPPLWRGRLGKAKG